MSRPLALAPAPCMFGLGDGRSTLDLYGRGFVPQLGRDPPPASISSPRRGVPLIDRD